MFYIRGRLKLINQLPDCYAKETLTLELQRMLELPYADLARSTIPSDEERGQSHGLLGNPKKDYL